MAKSSSRSVNSAQSISSRLEQPQPVLRSRTDTYDYQLLDKVRQAANDKARELGWTV
jgi:hypothetical protein